MGRCEICHDADLLAIPLCRGLTHVYYRIIRLDRCGAAWIVLL